MVEFIFNILFLFLFTNSLPLPKHKDKQHYIKDVGMKYAVIHLEF